MHGHAVLSPAHSLYVHGGRVNTCSRVVSYKLAALIHMELIILFMEMVPVCFSFGKLFFLLLVDL